MATKAEREAVARLLHELDTVRSWFVDTGYPRRSRETFEEEFTRTMQVFKLTAQTAAQATYEAREKYPTKTT